jgi:limonene-1,2-epoxide hydrolase
VAGLASGAAQTLPLRVRAGAVCALAAVALAAGCGDGSPSAESVVRAWSEALNHDDNSTAASLFAHDAKVVQLGRVVTLRTRADALAWNAALPCSGQIVSIHSRGDTATATFLLGNRTHSQCDGPGQEATAIFRVVRGKIVLWHQTASSGSILPAV